ncbi:uncharacterized protein VTP21DRAFT_1337 [Calcarisporiella thermophila]|uniref:uncharacterized protein n=1 Tax=Calcarisporiella thermophila TaxID=911321 RepID=UPI00374297C2
MGKKSDTSQHHPNEGDGEKDYQGEEENKVTFRSQNLQPLGLRHESLVPQSTPEEHAVMRAEMRGWKNPQKEAKDKKHVDIDEHLLTPQQCAAKYRTEIDLESPSHSRGLSDANVKQALEQYGPNVLSPPKRTHPFVRFLHVLGSLFNVLMIAAGIMVYITLAVDPVANFSNSYMGAILIVMAFINALIEFYQLQKSQAILESFLTMIPQSCRCVRDGALREIPAAELVPGDVVFVRMGDKIPADIFLFSSAELKVDNSSLTGESEPQSRAVLNDNNNPLEATNLLFNGTLAVAGEGYGIVVRTGDHTVLGQIAGLTASEEKRESPLAHEIASFVKLIATLAIITAVIFFGVGYNINNGNVALTLTFAIGILVAWVPQGLPATVTMLLTIAAKRMAARNVLVKDLQGVETLGAITLLATDKTGTLTRNRMTVTNLWTGLHTYSSSATSLEQYDLATPDKPGVGEILHISALCTRAKFDRVDVPVNERAVLGDATEAGLLRYAAERLPLFESIGERFPKVFEIPFNSDTKWHLTIHRIAHPSGDLTLFMKGAPERVLRLCSTLLTGSGAVPLTEDHRAEFQKSYELMAGKGHRVLAFAQLALPRDQYPAEYAFRREDGDYPSSGLTFVGLVSLEDPPKHGVREAIGRCRSAGIKVIMVTGDHPLTAEAIGRKINLVVGDTREMVARRTGREVEDVGENEYQAIVVHGEQIEALTDVQWDHIFSKNEIIFARTSPRHKLEIVKRAQAMGHIVGVTGDGVNDSPALKKADLGISMNKSGSDVSKEASAMILLDDNFASTVHGIEEGRLIFTNLKKSIRYTMSHITPELIPQLLYVIVPIPLPLLAIQILVIDLGFELFVALSYAWDKPESDSSLMALPPRKPVTPKSIERIRRLALHRTLTQYDAVSGELVRASWGRRAWHRLRRTFTAQYWRERFERTDAEVLVDFDTLMWAYVEIGLIETVGSLLAYFVVLYHNGITPSDAREMARRNIYFTDSSPNFTTSLGRTLVAADQKDALAQAQSIVYLGVMIMQLFNLFAVKARTRLPFGKHMFSNRFNFLGMLCGVLLGLLIVYVPPVNIPFGTSYRLLPLFWLIPVGFGGVIILYTVLRILVLRKLHPIRFNQPIPGLTMFPTVYSMEKGVNVIGRDQAVHMDGLSRDEEDAFCELQFGRRGTEWEAQHVAILKNTAQVADSRTPLGNVPNRKLLRATLFVQPPLIIKCGGKSGNSEVPSKEQVGDRIFRPMELPMQQRRAEIGKLSPTAGYLNGGAEARLRNRNGSAAAPNESHFPQRPLEPPLYCGRCPIIISAHWTPAFMRFLSPLLGFSLSGQALPHALGIPPSVGSGREQQVGLRIQAAEAFLSELGSRLRPKQWKPGRWGTYHGRFSTGFLAEPARSLAGAPFCAGGRPRPARWAVGSGPGGRQADGCTRPQETSRRKLVRVLCHKGAPLGPRRHGMR